MVNKEDEWVNNLIKNQVKKLIIKMEKKYIDPKKTLLVHCTYILSYKNNVKIMIDAKGDPSVPN